MLTLPLKSISRGTSDTFERIVFDSAIRSYSTPNRIKNGGDGQSIIACKNTNANKQSKAASITSTVLVKVGRES